MCYLIYVICLHEYIAIKNSIKIDSIHVIYMFDHKNPLLLYRQNILYSSMIEFIVWLCAVIFRNSLCMICVFITYDDMEMNLDMYL